MNTFFSRAWVFDKTHSNLTLLALIVQNNSKCSVRYIFKATKQGAFETVLVHFQLIDRASGYVDPDEYFQLEEEEDQDVEEEDLDPEEDESELIQVGQSHAEEPTETLVGVADDDQCFKKNKSNTSR